MTDKPFAKRIVLFSVFLTFFLLLNLPLINAADYEWNKQIPVKKPSPETDNGKLVLFDNSHMSAVGQADWVIDGAFSDFADALVKEGYTVKEYRGVDKNIDGIFTFFDDRKPENVDKNECIITFDAIKEADVFILAESNRPFRIDEYAALKKFIDSGKGIYFISDHYNADRNRNTWDSTETFNGYNRSTDERYNLGGVYGDLRNPQDAHTGWLAETFGVRFRFNAVDCHAGASDIVPLSESEGLTDGVEPVLIAAGCTLAVLDGSRAKGIVYLADEDRPQAWRHSVDTGVYFGGREEGPYVAISKPGKGKAAFIGDSSPIEDISPKYRNHESGKKKKTHDGWNRAGKADRLSVNIVNWLAKTENYVGFDDIEHSRGIETPEPMIDIEKNEQQLEPWSKPTVDPWNPATFKPGAYGAPKPHKTGQPGPGPGPGAGEIEIEPDFILAPDIVYKKEPFAVVISLNIPIPQLGAYKKSSGLQVGQVKETGDQWSKTGYSDLNQAAVVTVTAKVVDVESNMFIKVRVPGGQFKKKPAAGMGNGYGYISGQVPGNPGHIAAAIKENKIWGTAQVDVNKNVKIAVKSGDGIKLVLYHQNGKKKTDLPGSYEVKDNTVTAIH
jgi:hypothetical protein